MAVVSSGNPKFNKIVSTSKELFWRYGIKRVTIEEICKEAKVSKMTLYKFFKNKSDLAVYILEYIIENSMDKYREVMNSDIDFAEKVKKTIELKMEYTVQMSREFFSDIIKSQDKAVAVYYQNAVQEKIQLILSDYIKAQKEGNIRQDINPKFILYFLNKITELLEDEELQGLYSSTGDLIAELVNFFFYGIMPHN